MKTIFVPIFSGIEGKNILRAGIYGELKKRKDIRVIFFVGSLTRAEYYRREYPELTFEVIKRYRRTTLDRFFSFLKFFTLRTKTIDLKRQTHLGRTRNYLRFSVSWLLNRLIANRPMRAIIRSLDAQLVTDSTVNAFFKNYTPALVFLADLFEDTEISMLREAKRRSIPTIGYISTWDRLTSRWGIRLLPDHLIVFNALLKEEAVQYVDMPVDRIFVSGAVQLDIHLAQKPMSREVFLQQLQLPVDTKLIVYGPLGRTFDPSNQSDVAMVTLLNRWVAEGALGEGTYKIIVRFPPNDFVDRTKLLQLLHVLYDVPGVRFATIRGQDWDMRPEELDHLRNLLANASLVVCYYSSLSIDAAVFDVPVININFDLDNREKSHPYYQTTHYEKVAKVGGIKLVASSEALLASARQYLQNPALDRESRRLVVAEQAYCLDGKSAMRVVDKIESVLYNR